MGGSMKLHGSRFSMLTALAALIFSMGVRAQVDDQRREPRNAVTSNTTRPADPSDLARENLGRVAASSAQLQAVLLRDAGILVELKRWVAKEATDNGQIVEDALLTDQAIFDRLEHDVEFRSVATRLVQHYGYLLPSVNPESDIGKEQDLVMKERVRRLAQRQDREEAEALAAEDTEKKQEKQEPKVERTECDSRNPRDCNEPAATRGRRGSSRQDETPAPEPVLPILPDQMSPSDSTRTLRTAFGRDDSEGRGYSGLDSNPMALDFSRRSPAGLAGAMPPTGVDGVDSILRRGNVDDLAALTGGNRADASMASGKEMNRTVRLSGERGAWAGIDREDKSLVPVAMIHKNNPYSDIPSLYDMYVQAAPRDREPARFGMEIFRNGTRDMDAIPMDLPVGPDYVVGPGDGLAINLWGGVSQRIVRSVDREGRINLPEAGPLLVSGRTLGEVQESVQQVLRTQFRDVSADISLSRLRTIRVYVVGEVAEPGAYDISSLSTPLNAVFEAGGITERGSLRNLRHYRGKQLIEEVDAYDLLLHGVGSELKRLENGDSLLVPPMGAQVTISGMVRRPAVYELRGESTLSDALDLAGGILPAAALQHIEVQRLEAHEKRTMLTLDLSPNGSNTEAVTKQLSTFKIQDGDQIHIFPIAPYNEKAIYLQGHVLRPGRYSYHDGMKLADLIASYSDLLPEPAAVYAEIVRLNAPDFHPSVESFDLSAALADPAASPKLQPLDTVRVFSRYDFEPAPTVWVGGEVRVPGKYRTSGQAHLRDAIYLAGGVSTDAGLDSAQLFRTQPDGTLTIHSVNLRGALAGNSVDNILLEPRDRLLVHRNFAKVDPPTVYVRGEVAKPGRYPLTTNMHVEDLILVAGGLKRSADPVKADLARYRVGNLAGSSNENVPVELSAALSSNGNDNLPLRDGDVLTIREAPGWNDIGASASVRGEVQHAGSYGIRPGERLSSLLERAGGFSPEAYPYGAVLMRREVRDLEMKSHIALVQRIKAEQVNLKALPETDADQRNAKLTAVAQTETALTQLEATAPIGRVVVHIQPDVKQWRNTAADVPLRDGDVVLVPKKANYVMVSGQVFNPTAISYRPGRSAKWYLSQSGGLTQIADKQAVFVIRADGSVIAAKNNSGWWSGDPLSASLKPGDSIVVPEKAPRIGTRNWATTLQAAQIATSVALTVAYFKP